MGKIQSISPEELELLRKKAQAEVVQRQRAGTWQGGVVPHVAYQKRPVDWIVRYLGIPREHLVWSLNPGYELHTWDGSKDPLVVIAQSLADWQSVGVESGTGTGKAQPIDESVLTPTGWRAIGDLRVGDEVIGSNGRPTPVTGVFPQGRRLVYSLRFADGATTRACDEHLWSVQSREDRYAGQGYRVLSTAQLRDPSHLKSHSSWRVPLPKPVQWPEQSLPLDPYVVGVMLGDGSCLSATPRLTTADPEILRAVESATGAIARRRDGRYGYNLVKRAGPRNAVNPLMKALRDLGLAGIRAADKRVPTRYLLAAPGQRLALLQGLLDTDGTVRRGHPGFSSTSPTLANDVVHLVRSLGGLASIRREAAIFNKRRYQDSYRVHIRLPSTIQPFRLRRKQERVKRALSLARTIRSIEPTGTEECVCIQVAAKDQLYVTNDFVVTHNTFFGACLTYWFLSCFEDSIVPCVAPKEDQLLRGIWKELGRLWPRFARHFPMAEMNTGVIRMKPAQKDRETWAAYAFVCGVGADEQMATRAQGIHAEHMLIITEETPGIHRSIMNSLRETRTDDHNLQLALGNPDHQQDELHLFCKRTNTVHVRMSALDHPNLVTRTRVIPGTIGLRRIEERKQDMGEGTPLYNSRVRGISPPESEHALIRREWCEAAAAKWGDPKYRKGPKWRGVDVADSPTGDNAAIARGQGAWCSEVAAFPVEDANRLGYMVGMEMREDGIDPRYVGLDVVGVGAGTKNELKRLGIKVRLIWGNAKAVPRLEMDTLWSTTETDLEGKMVPTGPTVVQAEQFDNLRSQIYWRLREDLRQGRLAIPNDPQLFDELVAHQWTPKNGKICVQPKEDVVAILRGSPNKADALAYGNWVRGRIPLPDEEEKPAFDVPNEKDKNRDWRLERMLAHFEKQQRREHRRYLRRLGIKPGGRPLR